MTNLNWFELLSVLIILILVVFCVICIIAVRDVKQEIRTGKSKDFPKYWDEIRDI